MTERVFVTGATGVIGRRLVPDLVRLGLPVTAVGRRETRRRALEKMGATAVHLPSDESGRTSRFVAAQALAGHDTVINLATVAALRSRVQAGVYNIVDDKPLRRAEWVAALALAIGASMPTFMPAWVTRLGGSGMELLSRSQRISNETFKRASGWSPRWTSAREGLVSAVDSWLTTRPVRDGLRRSA